MSNARAPINLPRESPHYHRMRYYSAIRKGLKHMSQSTTYLDVPTHVIEDNAFIIFQLGGEGSGDGKHSSIATIFSVWNTMVGSSLLTIPWAFSNSGIIVGIAISFITFCIAYYTCSLYIRMSKNDSDFADTVYKYYGQKGWMITMLFSNLLMFAVIVIYYELMSQALFPVLAAIIEWITQNPVSLDTGLAFNRFSLVYTCIALTIILYPVVSKKDISLFIKLNSFGIIFVCFILLFIFSYGFYAFSNTTFSISNETNDFESSHRNLSLARLQFNKLAGMMTLGYYIHNVAISIVKENRNPENNLRDVFLGYLLVFLSYSLVGTLGYIGFSGYSFKISIRETENLLYMFHTTDVLAFIVRLMCFLQMFSVFPMLFCVTRNQFALITLKGREMGHKAALAFNAALIIIATIIGATFPQVGSLLGYVGGFVGLGLIYIIPIAVYLKRYKLRLEDPHLVRALDANRIKTVHGMKKNGLQSSPKIAIDTRASPRQNLLNRSAGTSDLSESLLSKELRPKPIDYKTYYFVCAIHVGIILVGFAILVLQFLTF